MKFFVTCTLEDMEASFDLDRERYYDARIEGLRLFMEKFKIPGTPTQYLSSKKGLIKVIVRSLDDRRKPIPTEILTLDFFIERLDVLRELFRTSEVDESIRNECQGLLLKARRVLDEQRISSV